MACVPTLGRRTAAIAAALSLAFLAGGAFLARDRLQAEYWIWKLGKSRGPDRQPALDRLVDLRSTRAVPYMIESVRREEAKSVALWVGTGGKASRATPAVYALWRMGEAALPQIQAAVEDAKDHRARWILRALLDRNGPPFVPANDLQMRGPVQRIVNELPRSKP